MKRPTLVAILTIGLLLAACQPPARAGTVHTIGSWRVQYKSVSHPAYISCDFASHCYDPPAHKSFTVVHVAVRYTGRGTGDPGFGLTYEVVGRDHVVYDEQFTCGATPTTLCDAPKLTAGGLTTLGVVFETPPGVVGGGQFRVTDDYSRYVVWSI